MNVAHAWDLYSALGIIAPDIQHEFAESADGRRTAWMVHADGSWARATGAGDDPPTVHQGGPRRLWDILDGIRLDWLRDGSLPVYGADATIAPDGSHPPPPPSLAGHPPRPAGRPVSTRADF